MQSNQAQTSASKDAPIAVEAFYAYGYKGRRMLAIRAPFAMGADGAEFIGHVIEANARQHVVVAIARQIYGPIHQGEPIGVELGDTGAAAAGDRRGPGEDDENLGSRT